MRPNIIRRIVGAGAYFIACPIVAVGTVLVIAGAGIVYASMAVCEQPARDIEMAMDKLTSKRKP